jgi:hypothetical protein
MKTRKWRIAFGVANTLAALVLTSLALREYRIFEEAHPGLFSHGTAGYMPLWLKVSYCWNAPSFVTAMWIHHLHRSWLGWNDYWFHFGYLEYYVCVFAFWWLLGLGIDEGSQPANGARKAVRYIAVVGTVFPVFLIYQVISGIHSPFTDNRAIIISTIAWSLVLVSLSGWLLLSLKHRSP